MKLANATKQGQSTSFVHFTCVFFRLGYAETAPIALSIVTVIESARTLRLLL